MIAMADMVHRLELAVAVAAPLMVVIVHFNKHQLVMQPVLGLLVLQAYPVCPEFHHGHVQVRFLFEMEVYACLNCSVVY